MLRLKKVSLVLASLWVIVLVATVSATIYREFDGPAVRTVTAQNIALSSENSSLNFYLGKTGIDLGAARADNTQLSANLRNAQSELKTLKNQMGSYATILPLKGIAPKAPLSVGIRFFP